MDNLGLVVIWEAGIKIAENKDWDFTAECMDNALNGNGKSRTYYNSSDAADMVKSSDEYQDMVKKFIKKYKQTGKITFSDSFEFDTPKDAAMALQHVNIKAEVKSNGNMLVEITDTYDFDTVRSNWNDIKKSKNKAIANAANDYGYALQREGILDPFDITIYTYEWAGK